MTVETISEVMKKVVSYKASNCDLPEVVQAIEDYAKSEAKKRKSTESDDWRSQKQRVYTKNEMYEAFIVGAFVATILIAIVIVCFSFAYQEAMLPN